MKKIHTFNWIGLATQQARQNPLGICKFLHLPVLLTLLVASLLSNFAETVVAPNEYTDVPSGGAYFGFESSDARYQNIYNPSEFLEAMPLGGAITEIAFRIDESMRTEFSAEIPDIEVRMSTSPSLAPFIPAPWAANVGPDETVVFPRGSIEFSVVSSESGPNPFSLRFPLAEPFIYDPRNGSLCVDLFIYEPASRTLLTDAAARDAGARVGSIGIEPSFLPGTPPVIQLTFTPVPEPSAVVIFMVGIAALATFIQKPK